MKKLTFIPYLLFKSLIIVQTTNYLSIQYIPLSIFTKYSNNDWTRQTIKRGQLLINPAVRLQTDSYRANKHKYPVDQQAFSTASSITENSKNNMDPALQGDFKTMTITTKTKGGGYGDISE